MKYRWSITLGGRTYGVGKVYPKGANTLEHLKAHEYGVWVFCQLNSQVHIAAYRFTAHLTF